MDKQQIQKCLFCQQKTSLCNLITMALQYKYEHKIEITIDDFVDSSKKKEIVQFYEKIFDHEEEYLEKQFQRVEQIRRLKTLTEYYKYEIHTPRLYMRKLEKTIRDYQKHKKNFHYNKIKQKLGLNQKDQQTLRVKTEPEKNNNIVNNLVLFDLTQEEPSKSVIELLNLINNQSKKKVQFANQIKQTACVTPSIQNSARNKILQKQLKAILQTDVIPKYQNAPISKRSVVSLKTSTLKSNTFHSAKSPMIQVNRIAIKMKSSPLIQLPKSNSQSKIQVSPKLKNLKLLLQHKS
ncbi:unnamed protein product [Paramecium primaurelia]|uniref:Uncharacterized protein n=2 Tax=Paramecium TaxID=5884 RepID=A0A8S1WZX1_9CILI|nr:unnamed protein product [Paramecium primaurelia]CAD8194070.1 unnamed protein product [Paramecium pentaurelia]